MNRLFLLLLITVLLTGMTGCGPTLLIGGATAAKVVHDRRTAGEGFGQAVKRDAIVEAVTGQPFEQRRRGDGTGDRVRYKLLNDGSRLNRAGVAQVSVGNQTSNTRGEIGQRHNWHGGQIGLAGGQRQTLRQGPVLSQQKAVRAQRRFGLARTAAGEGEQGRRFVLAGVDVGVRLQRIGP